MSTPSKKKKIAKQSSDKKDNRLGRTLKAETIKVFENYTFIKQNVELVSSIFKYIDIRYNAIKAHRNKNEFELMTSKVQIMKEETIQSIYRGIVSKENGKKFYNVLDYFLQSLKQIPTNISPIDPSVGNCDWNKYLAQPPFVIPSNIMDLIIEKEYEDTQIFSLMTLQIYSMANEGITVDILNIFQAYLTQQILEIQDIPLIEIFQKYIYCFIEKINFLEKNHENNNEARNDIKLLNLQIKVRNLLIDLANYVNNQSYIINTSYLGKRAALRELASNKHQISQI